jgi:hypothetical protein
MPITKRYFIIEHFQAFFWFKTKLNVFMSLEVKNREPKKFFELQKQRNKAKKCKKKKNDILFQILFLDPPLLTTIVSCSFLIHFERFQRLKMCYFKIYKTCLK